MQILALHVYVLRLGTGFSADSRADFFAEQIPGGISEVVYKIVGRSI